MNMPKLAAQLAGFMDDDQEIGYETTPMPAPLIAHDNDLRMACDTVAMVSSVEEVGRWLYALVYGLTEESWRAKDEIRAAVERNIP